MVGLNGKKDLSMYFELLYLEPCLAKQGAFNGFQWKWWSAVPCSVFFILLLLLQTDAGQREGAVRPQLVTGCSTIGQTTILTVDKLKRVFYLEKDDTKERERTPMPQIVGATGSLPIVDS